LERWLDGGGGSGGGGEVSKHPQACVHTKKQSEATPRSAESTS